MSENSYSKLLSEQPVLVIGAAGLDMIGSLKEAPGSPSFQAGGANPASIRVSYGGVGRNVAENLARLGQPVRFITATGKDQMGREMLAYTRACGVDVQACLISESYPTSSYLVVFEPDGKRHLALEDMSVMDALTPGYLNEQENLFAEAGMVFLDANLSPEVLTTVFQLVEKGQIPVCVDATSTRLAEMLLPFLEQVYMLTANSAEATMLCQGHPVVTDEETALNAARQLINQGVELAVISLAEFGVVYATSETSGHIPAVRTRVLDPTGAGDALTATVIFGLMNAIPIDETVRLGVTAASLILRYRGTVLPGLSLEKLYDELVV